MQSECAENLLLVGLAKMAECSGPDPEAKMPLLLLGKVE